MMHRKYICFVLLVIVLLVGSASAEYDGKNEHVSQFTSEREEFTPQPINAILWLRAMVNITIDQADYGKEWKQQYDYHQATPFSFLYGDLSSVELLKRCKISPHSKKLDKNRELCTVKYYDPKTKLELRWEGIVYRDFPTVEWTLYFSNTGSENTPILSDINPLALKMVRQGQYLLRGNMGDTRSPTSFQPITKILAPDTEYTTAPKGGRPTSFAFPYFNVECEGEGFIAVLSWPGQWKAQFDRDGGNELEVTAGQELTQFTLYPGEEVRTPRVVLQIWKDGDWIDAQNVWRRWMMAYNMPRPGGKLIRPMNLGSNYRVHHEMTKATEKNLIPFIKRFLEEDLRIDCWWMDAGWYPCDGNWPKTGSWWPDSERFPNGLKAISDFAHQNGMKTMLWFEPERVASGTWLATEHPEWIHGGAAGGLLKLHKPEVLEWLTNHIDKVMTENGIDNYRQDFNMDPLEHWRKNDSKDRQGITEIKHVTNYLAYYAALTRRHPDMFIDTCSSGGRRLSLDTLRYAVPLWRSDYQYVSDHMQALTYGLSFWVPYYGGGNIAFDGGYYGEGFTPVNPYSFWSCCYPAINCAIDIRVENMDYDALRDLFQKRDRMIKYYDGDFYPLTPYSLERNVWMAWQFNQPETGEGLVQAFRRGDNNFFGCRLKLRGLQPDARYGITDFDIPGKTRMTGRELMEQGLDIIIKDKPGAAVITYKKV